MAPKKKGPFFFFMQEIQNVRRERRLPCALEDVREEAAEMWTRLGERERARYAEMANQYKERSRASLHNKFTSDGRRIALVLKEEDEHEKLRRDMVTGIQQYVDDMGSLERVKKWPLYIISTNILCEANGTYYPLEIALIEYSIEQGFMRAFHQFINPGNIPLGFASAAKDHSADTHGIPIIGFEEGTSDYFQFVQDVFAFFRGANEEQCLPVFTMQDHIQQAEGCLRWIEEASGAPINVQVWDILPLLRKLRSVAGDEISQSEAEDVLNSSLFDYDVKSLCDYHARIDNKYCALGQSRRLGYKMSNALLGAYKIEGVIAYQHLPPRLESSLGLQISQLDVKPAQLGLGRRMHPPAGRRDEGSTPRSGHPSAPLPREARCPDDYYGERTGPTVVATSSRPGTTYGSACSSSAVDEFPSLCESMQKCQPPSRGARSGKFSHSSSSSVASNSDKSQTASMTSDASQYGGARPKSRVTSRLAAQFQGPAAASSVAQGIGRGLVSPGSDDVPTIPRQPRAPLPVYIKLRKPGNDMASRGIGRGSAF